MNDNESLEETMKKMLGGTVGKTLELRYQGVTFAIKQKVGKVEFSVSGMNPENVVVGFNHFKKKIELELDE